MRIAMLFCAAGLLAGCCSSHQAMRDVATSVPKIEGEIKATSADSTLKEALDRTENGESWGEWMFGKVVEDTTAIDTLAVPSAAGPPVVHHRRTVVEDAVRPAVLIFYGETVTPRGDSVFVRFDLAATMFSFRIQPSPVDTLINVPLPTPFLSKLGYVLIGMVSLAALLLGLRLGKVI